jgi:hypothetical protein
MPASCGQLHTQDAASRQPLLFGACLQAGACLSPDARPMGEPYGITVHKKRRVLVIHAQMLPCTASTGTTAYQQSSPASWWQSTSLSHNTQSSSAAHLHITSACQHRVRHGRLSTVVHRPATSRLRLIRQAQQLKRPAVAINGRTMPEQRQQAAMQQN